MKTKNILVSIILVMLIFFSFANPVQASLFSDDDDKSKVEETIDKDNASFFDDENKDSEIIETIDEDDGGIFEKIIAKMIRWCSRNCI